MPTTIEIEMTVKPISSDSRVPWISRDSISRPMASVPSGCAHEPPACQNGGLRKALLSVRIGE